MNDIVKNILKKQKIKIQLIGDIKYNIYSYGQVIHPAAGTILLINKIKLNNKETWIEFKGVFKDDHEKPVKFSIHPKNINKSIKVLD